MIPFSFGASELYLFAFAESSGANRLGRSGRCVEDAGAASVDDILEDANLKVEERGNFIY
jgi:hypothetical protein